MTKILAIDSSTSACSAAVSIDGDIEERFELAAQEHTRRLLPMVDDLLKSRCLGLTDLDAIAFTQGPGSFTGLRIGVGVVQGLAFGAGLPVVPLSTLEVLAVGAQRILNLPAGELVVPVLDARMGEVYGALYETGSHSWEPRCIVADCVAEAGNLLATIASASHGRQLHVVGGGGELLKAANSMGMDLVLHEGVQVHALDAVAMAGPRLASGQTITALDAVPVYIRNEVSWAKRKRIRDQKQ